jgi:hypothetical protein
MAPCCMLAAFVPPHHVFHPPPIISCQPAALSREFAIFVVLVGEVGTRVELLAEVVDTLPAKSCSEGHLHESLPVRVYLCEALVLLNLNLFSCIKSHTPLDLLTALHVASAGRMRREDGALMGATPAEVVEAEAFQGEGLGATVRAGYDISKAVHS